MIIEQRMSLRAKRRVALLLRHSVHLRASGLVTIVTVAVFVRACMSALWLSVVYILRCHFFFFPTNPNLHIQSNPDGDTVNQVIIAVVIAITFLIIPIYHECSSWCYKHLRVTRLSS